MTVDAALAGVGAVGCALIHTLWACPGIQGKVILADNDPEGVDETNLNRYALFGLESVGHPKAKEAARIARDSPILWEPFDLGIEDIQRFPVRHSFGS